MHSCVHWFIGEYTARVRDNNSGVDMYGDDETRKGTMKSNYQYGHTDKVI